MLKRVFGVLVLVVLVWACSSSDSNDNPNGSDNFDRGAMLTNYADNFIIPSLTDFNTKLIALEAKAKNFNENPAELTLEDVRTAWYQAYKAWQKVAMYNIGKAEELQFVNHFNIYPLNATDVEANILNGGYDLNHPNNHDAQGFPALDYLLYGVAETDEAIIAKFSTDANAAKYQQYLTDIVAKMESVMTEITNDWNGGYRNSFISSTDNTATSSLNKLVNDYIYYYEKQLRANKIGIPAGNFSSTPLPEKVEAFYRQNVSKELILEALTNFEKFFTGNSSGESFKTYLEKLGKKELATKITNQLSVAKSAINDLDSNFYNQVKTDNSKMTKAYDELQKAVVLIKVDMLQAFNVSVDYVDADGD